MYSGEELVRVGVRGKRIMTQAETIENRERFRPWNQGNMGIVGEMDLYHEAKCGEEQTSSQTRPFFKFYGLKSLDQRLGFSREWR